MKGTVASYLLGQESLETAKKQFPKGGRNWGYPDTRKLREIADACEKTPQILPRLGRFLILAEWLSSSAYGHTLDELEELLPGNSIFIDSGLGPDIWLQRVFRRNQAPDAESAAFVLNGHPAEYERFLRESRPDRRLAALAFLCAERGLEPFAESSAKNKIFAKNKGAAKGEDPAFPHKSEGFANMLEEDLSTGLYAMAHGRWSDFTESAVALCPAAADALRHVGENRKKGKDFTEEKTAATTGILILAIYMTQGKLRNVNALAQAVCASDYGRFFDAMYSGPVMALAGRTAWIDRLTQDQQGYEKNADEASLENVREDVRRLADIRSRLGIDEIWLYAWLAQKSISNACAAAAWNELHEDRPDLAEPAALRAALPERFLIFRKLAAAAGGTAPADAESLVRAYAPGNTYIHGKDLDRIVDWIFEKSNDPVSDLPKYPLRTDNEHQLAFADHRVLDNALLLLHGLHPASGRYLRYVIEKGYALYVKMAAVVLMNLVGLSAEQVAQTLLDNTDSAKSVLFCLNREEARFSPANMSDLGKISGIITAAHPADAAAVAAETDDIESALYYLESLYRLNPSYDGETAIEALGHKSKRMRDLAVAILTPRKELADRIRPLTEAKKKAVREGAEQLVAAYESVDAGTGGAGLDLLALCMKNTPKNGLSAVKWAFPSDMPRVRLREGDAMADEQISNCYLIMMLSAKAVDLPPLAATIRAALKDEDLHGVAASVYSRWIADGAPAKQRGALLLFGYHATDGDVLTLNKQINDWAESSRGAIAAEAVRAMAFGAGNLALMTVDTIGRKFKNKQVRKAGVDAFAAAAQSLGTTADVLGDRIIPTLGFDARGEKTIDYGTRTFTVCLSPALAVEIKDENGKTVKSLPKPGAKDDEEKANAAKLEFSALKKSLKAVVDTQRQRLEQALAMARYWDREAWERLFVQNPIMHTFAEGLVWGVYEQEALRETFRYLSDGSFTTVEEEDLSLADATGTDGKIGLAHPLDLNADSLDAWKQQLSDYEIEQPFPQLAREIYLMDAVEKDATLCERFAGKQLLSVTLSNKLLKSGWYRGSVQDGGWFHEFYKEASGIGTELLFSGMCVGYFDAEETATVGQLCFYKAGTIDRGSYVYDEVKENEIIPLKDIPARLFSETMLELTAATASAATTDPGWRSGIGLVFAFERKAR
jgi:hypothetical protein